MSEPDAVSPVSSDGDEEEKSSQERIAVLLKSNKNLEFDLEKERQEIKSKADEIAELKQKLADQSAEMSKAKDELSLKSQELENKLLEQLHEQSNATEEEREKRAKVEAEFEKAKDDRLKAQREANEERANLKNAEDEAQESKRKSNDEALKREQLINDKIAAIAAGSPFGLQLPSECWSFQIGEFMMFTLLCLLSLSFCLLIDKYINVNRVEETTVTAVVKSVVQNKSIAAFSAVPVCMNSSNASNGSDCNTSSTPYNLGDLPTEQALWHWGVFGGTAFIVFVGFLVSGACMRWKLRDYGVLNFFDEIHPDAEGTAVRDLDYGNEKKDAAVQHLLELQPCVPCVPAACDEEIESQLRKGMTLCEMTRFKINLRNVIYGIFVLQYVMYMLTIVWNQGQATEILATDMYLGMKMTEAVAILSHTVALFLGLVMIHRSYLIPTDFVLLSDFFHMIFVYKPDDEFGQFDARQTYESIGKGLSGIWLAASNIVDLVDITDFYLLLVEEDLLKSTKETFFMPFRWLEGMYGHPITEWDAVRLVWLLALWMTLLWNSTAILVRGIRRVLQKCLGRDLLFYIVPQHMPDGMDFWRCFFARSLNWIEDHKNQDFDSRAQLGGAKDFYDFDFNRRLNQINAWNATRSLFFVELPFLVWRLYCSVQYDIMASSLLIKNVLSIMYDSYMIGSGIRNFRRWKVAGQIVQRNVQRQFFKTPLLTLADDTTDDNDDGETVHAKGLQVPYEDTDDFLYYRMFVPRTSPSDSAEFNCILPPDSAVVKLVTDESFPTALSSTGFVA